MAKLMLGSRKHVVNVEQGLEGTIRGRIKLGEISFCFVLETKHVRDLSCSMRRIS